MQVKIKAFQQLTNTELFQIYKLRTKVFVVEQNCAYQEVDEDDLIAEHLQLINAQNKLVGYLRLIPEKLANQIRIGRVVVNPQFRGQGYGRTIITESLKYLRTIHPEITQVVIQAQAYLVKFYGSFEFQATSDVYLDTGIPHQDMLLKPELSN